MLSFPSVGGECQGQGGACHPLTTRYREVTQEVEIVEHLKTLLADDVGDEVEEEAGDERRHALIRDYHLLVFAKYTTARKTYAAGDVTVVLDRLDFGYEVGEIEIIVRDGNDDKAVRDAVERVDKMAADLGE